MDRQRDMETHTHRDMEYGQTQRYMDRHIDMEYGETQTHRDM